MDESRSSQDVFDTLVVLVRKWRIFAPFLLVTPVVVFVLTTSRAPTYEASADVLANRQGYVLAGLRDTTFWYPSRALLTQASLARLPEVAQRVVDATGVSDRGRYGFLAQSWVEAGGPTDVMTFHVRDGDPELAARLATTYAEQYIAYRRDLDSRSLRRAIAVVTGQVERSRAQRFDPIGYADLVRQQQQLHTALASVETNATLVRPAGEATHVALGPERRALLALVLALVTGGGLAALTVLLDPRARTANEISEQLRLALIGQLPLERHPKRGDGLTMLRNEESPSAEAMRVLRTNLELDSVGQMQGVVLVTSSVDGEGKSTTAANLALALALAGRSVVLVDLDLRRPVLARLFGLPRAPGIADIVHGAAELEESTHGVQLDRPGVEQSSPGAADSSTGALLRVVTAGTPLAAETHEVAMGRALPAMLESLRRLADVVLLDGPPLLKSGEALALSRHADGLLLVLHMKRYRRRYGGELGRLLALSPAIPLGLVVVGEPGELAPVARDDLHGRAALERGFRALGRA